MTIYVGKSKSKEVVESNTGADNTWMLKKSAELMKLNEENTTKLMGMLDPSLYLNNPGFVSGKDPDTYVNQKKDFLNKALSSTAFIPPSANAAEMWQGYTSQFTNKEISAGIGVEASTRVNARHQEVTSGVRMMVDTLTEYPTKNNFNDMIENVHSYIDTIDLEPGAEQYLPAGTSTHMAREAKKNISNTYLKYAADQDPIGVIDDIYDNQSYWKGLGLSDGDLIGHVINAQEKYKAIAVEDTKAIISMLKDNFQKIIDNGGDLSVSDLGKMNPGDFTHDEFVMKLGMLLPWFENGMKPNAPRTKDNESQRTATSEMNGITYLYPTIRFNIDGSQMELEDPFQYALDQGDALVVKDNEQGTRISKYMSRVLK
tara:strand:- start:458 stop:1573 length:1116 start_codon:yes stop_codon:yes gene_type:complete